MQEGCRFLCECAWTEPSLVWKPYVGARSWGKSKSISEHRGDEAGLGRKVKASGHHEAISRCCGCGCQQQKPPELSTLIPRSHTVNYPCTFFKKHCMKVWLKCKKLYILNAYNSVTLGIPWLPPLYSLPLWVWLFQIPYRSEIIYTSMTCRVEQPAGLMSRQLRQSTGTILSWTLTQ